MHGNKTHYLSVVKGDVSDGCIPINSEEYCGVIRFDGEVEESELAWADKGPDVTFEVKQNTTYSLELFKILRHYLDFNHQDYPTRVDGE